MLETLAASPLTRAVGLALVHFIWQGLVIGFAAAWLLHALREARASTRYVAGCGALVLMASAPVVTTVRAMSDAPAPTANVLGMATAPEPAVPGSVPSSPEVPVSSALAGSASGSGANEYASLFPTIVLTWAAGVVILTTRLIASWLRARHVRRAAWPIGNPWRRRMDGLAKRLGLTRYVALSESAAIDVPTLVGWMRPTILVPASVLTGLTPAQLDAILAHELAHVRRHDYLVNIFQSAIETLLFYHPAVWWVSRRVRLEREMCCDDVVVTICSDRVVYARALASLEELRGQRAVLGVAATGGQLLRRVRRILAPDAPGKSSSSAWSAFATVVALAPVVLIGAAAEPAIPAGQGHPALVNTLATVPAPAPAGPVRVEMAPAQTPAAAPGAPRGGATSLTPAALPADALPQIAAPANATVEQKAVLALEEQFRLAKVQNDVKALDRLLDDDVVSTNQVGVVRRKADLLELWETFRVDLLTLDSANVQITGDLATVTGRQTEVSGTGDYPMLFTRIWRRSGSTWRLFSVTQFRDPNPPPTPVARRTTQLFRLEYELFRDNALIGRPVANVVSGRPWAIQIPGEPAVSALVGAGADNSVTLGFTPGPAGGPQGSLVLRGEEPADVSWSSGPRSYRLRIRNVTGALPVVAQVGSDTARPNKIRHVDPVYPPEAKNAKVGGMVILEAVIDEEGNVADLKVIRSVPMLDAAALDAVRQWKYQPTLMNGKPVRVMMTMNVTFAVN